MSRNKEVEATLLGVILGTRLHQGEDDGLGGVEHFTWYGFHPYPNVLPHLPPAFVEVMERIRASPKYVRGNLSFGINMLSGGVDLMYDDDADFLCEECEEDDDETELISISEPHVNWIAILRTTLAY